MRGRPPRPPVVALVVAIMLAPLAGCVNPRPPPPAADTAGAERLEALATRVADLEREVAGLRQELRQTETDQGRFANESAAHAGSMLQLVATIGELQRMRGEDEQNHSEAERRWAVVEHFMAELKVPPPVDPRVAQELAQARGVADAARHLTVKLRVELPGGTHASGTGWSWGSDLVVTAAHVVSLASAGHLTLLTLDGRVLDGSVVNASASQDTALVSAPGLGLPGLPRGPAASLHAGDAIVVIGHPQGYAAWSVSLGHMIDKAVGAARPRFHSTAPIAPGNSGGPVFDIEGRVVGMTIGGIWPPAEDAAPSPGAPTHVHVAPLTAAAEIAVHVPIGTIEQVVGGWTASG